MNARVRLSDGEQERLAQTLEQMAARVRASSVVDYTVDIENGTRDVPNGSFVQREYDGRTRFAVTITLEPRLVTAARMRKDDEQ